MDPVLRRKVIERRQIGAILDQTINGAGVFGAVFLGKGFECKLSGGSGRRHEPHAALHGARNLVEHVDGLVRQ
jgi:hypothetical protein